MKNVYIGDAVLTLEIQRIYFVYNMWKMKIPYDEIERVTEEYVDDIPGHEYNIIFKNQLKKLENED